VRRARDAVDVINAIRGAPITIARLADAAHVNEIFLGGVDPQFVDPLALHAFIPDESHRHMSVTEKANGGVLISEARRGVEIIEDIAPLLGRIESRVDNAEIAHLPL